MEMNMVELNPTPDKYSTHIEELATTIEENTRKQNGELEFVAQQYIESSEWYTNMDKALKVLDFSVNEPEGWEQHVQEGDSWERYIRAMVASVIRQDVYDELDNQGLLTTLKEWNAHVEAVHDRIRDDIRELSNEMQRDIQTIVDAERAGVEIQNGKQRNVDASKNTHFEYEFGGDGTPYPEVSVYFERDPEETGMEIMLWADRDWFTEEKLTEKEYVGVEDAVYPLRYLGSCLLDEVEEVVELNARPQYEFHSFLRGRGSDSVVFHTTMRIPED